METAAKLNGIIEALSTIPKLLGLGKTGNKTALIVGDDKDDAQDKPVQATRRLAIGLASIAIVGTAGVRKSLAEDNGFSLTGPLPVPYAINGMLSSSYSACLDSLFVCLCKG